jgi:hypothetical protein
MRGVQRGVVLFVGVVIACRGVGVASWGEWGNSVVQRRYFLILWFNQIDYSL